MVPSNTQFPIKKTSRGGGHTRKRDRVRTALRRLRERQRMNAAKGERRMRKRKAALALSAATMGLSTGAIDPTDMLEPAAMANMLGADVGETRQNAVAMSASEEFKQALIEEEGVREIVYRDVAGYPTVGVGHLVQPEDRLHVGQRVSYDRIIDFLEDDLQYAEDAVARLVGDLPLAQHEFDALVDLVYNVGEGNVSKRQSPKLNAAIAAGDYEGIADELAYHAAGGATANGLVYRSERRTQIFLDAEYTDPRPANA